MLLAILSLLSVIVGIFAFRLKVQKAEAHKVDVFMRALYTIGPVVGILMPLFTNLILFIILTYQLADLSRDSILSLASKYLKKL